MTHATPWGAPAPELAILFIPKLRHAAAVNRIHSKGSPSFNSLLWFRALALKLSLLLMGLSAFAIEPITDDEIVAKTRAGELISNVTVNASSIAKAISALHGGSIRLRNSEINGDLSLGTFEETIPQLALVFSADACKFKGSVELWNCKTTGELRITSCSINDGVRLHHVNADSVNLMNTDFGSYLRLEHCAFREVWIYSDIQTHFYVTDTQVTGTCLFRTTQHKVQKPEDWLDIDRKRRKLDSFYVIEKSSFGESVDFSTTELSEDTRIESVTFAKPVSFNRSKLPGSMKLEKLFFSDRADFQNLNQGVAKIEDRGSLYFEDVKFREAASFADSYLTRLSFGYLPDAEVSRFVTFEKTSVFDRAHIGNLAFNKTEFEGDTSLNDMSITRSFFLREVTFRGSVGMAATVFPMALKAYSTLEEVTSGIAMYRVRFLKTIDLEWEQLFPRAPSYERTSRVSFCDSISWHSLEGAFQQSGDIDAKNKAFFQYKRQLRQESSTENHVTNVLSELFWGYGVRPLRCVFWLLVSILLSSLVYLTQIAPSSRKPDLIDLPAYKALYFSARTAWGTSFGIENAVTPFFKCFTLFQSIVSKVIFVCILQAITNTSPLLNAIVGKLVHV